MKQSLFANCYSTIHGTNLSKHTFRVASGLEGFLSKQFDGVLGSWVRV